MTNEELERLSEKPASPLPWKLRDNVIIDANGEPVCGHDMLEFDADYIYRAIVAYEARREGLDRQMLEEVRSALCSYSTVTRMHLPILEKLANHLRGLKKDR